MGESCDEEILYKALVNVVVNVHPFLDWEALQMVIHILVTSWFDYCSALHMGLLLKAIQKLQIAHNTGSVGHASICHFSIACRVASRVLIDFKV